LIRDSDPNRLKCGFRDCDKEPVGKAIYLEKNRECLLCEVHLNVAKSNPKAWRVLSQHDDKGDCLVSNDSSLLEIYHKDKTVTTQKEVS